MGYNPIETYLEEAEELLADIEQSALNLGAEDSRVEMVNRLFRAFHTLKGSGAMCGLRSVADFTHHVESLLDKVREGTVTFSPALTELVLAAADQIKRLLAAEQGGRPADVEATRTLIKRVEELSDMPPGAACPPVVGAASDLQDRSRAERTSPSGETGQTWRRPAR